MSRRSSAQQAVLGLALALLGSPLRAQAALDVAGEVLATDPRLEVRVTVTNRGAQPTGSLDVSGDWRDQRSSARIPEGLAPGASGSAVLSFDVAMASPGVHALPLLLEHPLDGARDAGGNAPLASQRAWLLVALEAAPEADVRVAAAPARIGVRGRLDVDLSSLDGQAHRVQLRVLTARGLRVDGGAAEVQVPPSGSARIQVPLMRAGAARGSQHGVLLLAESRDALPLRTAVAVGQVTVASEGGLLPRARAWLLAVASVLLGLAVGTEAWRTLRGRSAA